MGVHGPASGRHRPSRAKVSAIAVGTHQPIWSCPQGPGFVVDWLRARYELTNDYDVVRAVGGWKNVAEFLYGGWKSERDLLKDWGVQWHQISEPMALPLYVVVSSGIEHVFAPFGVEAEDLICWAEADEP